jgi:hypothetical protein
MAARPIEVVRDVPEVAVAVAEDLEDEVLVDTAQPASLWIYLRGWLRIGLLVSATMILGIALYLVPR